MRWYLWNFCNLLLIQSILGCSNFPSTSNSLNHVIALSLTLKICIVYQCLTIQILASCAIKWIISSILLLNVSIGFTASIWLVLHLLLLTSILNNILCMVHLIVWRYQIVLVLKVRILTILPNIELAMRLMIEYLELWAGIWLRLLSSHCLVTLSATSSNKGLAWRYKLRNISLFTPKIVFWCINHSKIILNQHLRLWLWYSSLIKLELTSTWVCNLTILCCLWKILIWLA